MLNEGKGLLEIYSQISEIQRRVGNVEGKIDQILRKLEILESKSNGADRRSIRSEECITRIEEKLNDHLQWHKSEEGWKASLRASVIGGVTGSVTAFILSLLLR